MKDISKPVAVFSAKKAIKDYNKKLVGFSEMKDRMKKFDAMGNPIDKQTGQPMMSTSSQPNLDIYMGSQGIPATHASKAATARSMGMNDYYGAAHQDEALMMAMQAKDQNEAMKMQGESEKSGQNRDYQLKERELALKENQSIK